MQHPGEPAPSIPPGHQGLAAACPVCGSADPAYCADLGPVPVFQNARYPDAASARDASLGRLCLAACRCCGFAFNAAFDPDLARYDVTYENDQTMSARFAAHVEAVLDKALSLTSHATAATVLEIGCGQGTFLRQLLAASEGRIARAIGLDPSVRNPISAGALRIEAKPFDADVAHALGGDVDLVVLRHVIEHIHRPFVLLSSLRNLASAARPCQVLIETPCFEWILEHKAWHDVFYEHCNYFTAGALAHLMRRAGLARVVVDRVFGGQYLLASAEVNHDGATEVCPPPEAAAVAAMAQAFGRTLDDYARRWRRRLGAQTPFALWGAAAKGVTFAAIVGDGAPLRCLIDIDPKKQGTFAARTGLPIVPPSEAPSYGVGRVVVMNPNYAREIEALIARLGLPLEVIVMDQDT